MNWPIDARGVALVKESEGLSLTSYRCPAGVWTIGFGETGPDVGPDTRWTLEQADERLCDRLEGFADAVRALCKITPTSTELAAMVSLTYNIGTGAFRHSSVLRHHNAGRTQDAADCFGKWVKATVKGELVTLPGLVTRRKRESELYLSPS